MKGTSFGSFCPLGADRTVKENRASNKLKMLQAWFFGSAFNWANGSGSRQAKIVRQQRNKFKKFVAEAYTTQPNSKASSRVLYMYFSCMAG